MNNNVKIIIPILLMLLTGCTISLKDYYPYNQLTGKKYTFTVETTIDFGSEVGSYSRYNNFSSNLGEEVDESVFKVGSTYYLKIIPFETEFEIVDVIIDNYGHPITGSWLELIGRIDSSNEKYSKFSIMYLNTDYKVDGVGSIGSPTSDRFMEVNDEDNN